MDKQSEYAAHLVDLLENFGPVQAKRMFGGFGLFFDGLMFGLIADSSLYLKVDSISRPVFDERGLEPFTYYKKEKAFQMSYCLAPEEFFEDEEETLRWARLAYDAALRAPKKPEKKKKSSR